MKVLLIVVILVIFIVILLSRKKHKSSRISSNNSYSLPPKKVYKSVYDYLLHDSRWLDCRNRILKRDGYRCKWCGEKIDLQIHHKYYHKLPNNHFVNPWEYDDDCFITLCKTCHNKWHEKHSNKVYYRSWKDHHSILKEINDERN